MRLAALALSSATLIGLAACAPMPETDAPSPGATLDHVTVSATYRERIALTPGHVVTFRIEDVSLADAPARLIAESRQTLAGEMPPYEHRFSVPRSEIDPRHTYAARVDIRDPAGALRFTTDTHYRVLTQGAPDRVDIVLIGVR